MSRTVVASRLVHTVTWSRPSTGGRSGCEWAKANGIPVSDRGRIPASIAEQYQAATR
jgi:hypothetical protein